MNHKINERINKFNDIVSHNLKEFIEPSDFSKVNHLRISKANSIEHEVLKATVFTKLVHAGLNVLVEANLKSPYTDSKPDLLVLDLIPCVAYEIVNTEKEISLLNKEVKYPFKIKVVKTNEVKNE